MATLNRKDENALIEKLLTLLDTPENWEGDSSTLALKKDCYGRIEIWTFMPGLFGFYLYLPAKVRFRFFNRVRLARAVRRVQRQIRNQGDLERLAKVEQSLSRLKQGVDLPVAAVSVSSATDEEWPEHINGRWMS